MLLNCIQNFCKDDEFACSGHAIKGFANTYILNEHSTDSSARVFFSGVDENSRLGKFA